MFIANDGSWMSVWFQRQTMKRFLFSVKKHSLKHYQTLSSFYQQSLQSSSLFCSC